MKALSGIFGLSWVEKLQLSGIAIAVVLALILAMYVMARKLEEKAKKSKEAT